MPTQVFRYIEDEKFYNFNLNARFYSENSLKAVPMIVFPVPAGSWSVAISAEGYQPTSSTTDPHRGKIDGMIGYSDDEADVWNVGVYANVEITNNKADNAWKYGHPDYEVNNCHFNQRQCIERDSDISFHVKTTGDNAAFFLVGPAIQKQSKYNYAVSYGDWTDRDMEIGLIHVSLDERHESGSKKVRRLHKGAVKQSTTHRSMTTQLVSLDRSSSASSSLEDVAGERKPYQTPSVATEVKIPGSSSSGSLVVRSKPTSGFKLRLGR
ncbi:hypothetical protein 3 [Wuhan insect virus 20]|uniref:hypothetical protein 3 n=1 Tax=Wuhan insect virus 20 TaxID=1923724 RepID=UPI000909D1BC|nr:hypothetical protein 3 [Wuhan insect virus 20]APG76543.1 hypothetical protein 3 [Wuhan insect virus 20]